MYSCMMNVMVFRVIMCYVYVRVVDRPDYLDRRCDVGDKRLNISNLMTKINIIPQTQCLHL